MDHPSNRHSAEADDSGHGGVQILVAAGPVRFAADEPAALGGLDIGPSPLDLVAAGLAACTTMTLRLYAKQKGWPLTRIHVEVDHLRDAHATPADRFVRVMTIEGALDETQRARLLEIANRCPVHRLLQSGAQIETSYAPAQGPDARA